MAQYFMKKKNVEDHNVLFDVLIKRQNMNFNTGKMEALDTKLNVAYAHCKAYTAIIQSIHKRMVRLQ
jgi:hypothetical protein